MLQRNPVLKFRFLRLLHRQHLRHLKVRFPYLYSLAVRSNPLAFEDEVCVLS